MTIRKLTIAAVLLAVIGLPCTASGAILSYNASCGTLDIFYDAQAEGVMTGITLVMALPYFVEFEPSNFVFPSPSWNGVVAPDRIVVGDANPWPSPPPQGHISLDTHHPNGMVSGVLPGDITDYGFRSALFEEPAGANYSLDHGFGGVLDFELDYVPQPTASGGVPYPWADLELFAYPEQREVPVQGGPRFEYTWFVIEWVGGGMHVEFPDLDTTTYEDVYTIPYDTLMAAGLHPGGTYDTTLHLHDTATGLESVHCGFFDFTVPSENTYMPSDPGTVVAEACGGSESPWGIDLLLEDVEMAGFFTAEYTRAFPEMLDPDVLASMDFALGEGLNAMMTLWDLEFTGGFASATLTFGYDDSALVVPEQDLLVFHQRPDGTWVALPKLGQDLEANTITVSTTSFSLFTLGVPEPATLMLLAVGGLAMIRRRRSA